MGDISETEPEVDNSTSVFVDNFELIDSALLESKLGDTCTGVPGRLLGKSPFYLDVHASQYIIDTIHTGYKLLLVSNTPPPKFYKHKISLL